jgi:hypothetical protein
MLTARLLVAAGIVSSSLAVAPVMATEPAPAEDGAPTAVIRRIQATPSVAIPKADAPAPLLAAGHSRGPADARLDQRAREAANLRSQAVALRSALDLFLASVERTIQRLELAGRSEPTPSSAPAGKSPKAVTQPAPAKTTSPSPKTSSATPLR